MDRINKDSDSDSDSVRPMFFVDIERFMIAIRSSAIDNVPFSSCFGVGYLIITWLISNHI